MPLTDVQYKSDYRSSDSDPVSDFYVPSLLNARSYIRAAGYFRSSILRLVGPAFVQFGLSGGKAVLICSPELTEEDAKAIEAGVLNREEVISRRLTQDVDDLLRASLDQGVLETLATLVASGVLNVRVACLLNGHGIYHEKLGRFQDSSGNIVSFIGSANETGLAWSLRGNFESIEVFCSWHSDQDLARTERHSIYLEQLAAGDVPGLHVLAFPDAARKKLIAFAKDSLEALLNQESGENRGARRLQRTPLPHQSEAIASWKRASYRGILKHATGSGKTFTAICAIAEHVDAGRPALVLVPSQLLMLQWIQELKSELPNAVILAAGGGETRWKAPGVLAAHTGPDDFGSPLVTVAVMASASSKEFVAKIDGGEHLLLVADEVHQVGSAEYSRSMSIPSGKRLGLSATPERFGDPEGTQRITSYFGSVLQPEFTLKDAINSGRLVPYEYHPIAVKLTESESDQWKDLTKKISRLVGRQAGGSAVVGGEQREELKKLMLRRARIAKKAAAKIEAVSHLIYKNYASGSSWLVYCEDVDHMEALATSLRRCGLEPTLYYAGMRADRNQTLEWFRSCGGLVLAVRCLDEGIDIPSVSHAVLVASSQNPRQFIQRRGRVLRSAPGKTSSVLFDILVLPVDGEDDPLRALESEFVRALEFAQDAMNKAARLVVLDMASSCGIDLLNSESNPIEEGNSDDQEA